MKALTSDYLELKTVSGKLHHQLRRLTRSLFFILRFIPKFRDGYKFGNFYAIFYSHLTSNLVQLPQILDEARFIHQLQFVYHLNATLVVV